MPGIGKQIQTCAFRVALWAGIGAGFVASIGSAQKEQSSYPSLSEQDSSKLYHNQIELGGRRGWWRWRSSSENGRRLQPLAVATFAEGVDG